MSTATSVINPTSKFIITENYKHIESKVVKSSNPKIFALLGPKGVGKTTALIVLWLQLLKQKDTHVIFTSDKVATHHNLEIVAEYNTHLAPDLLAVIKSISLPTDYANFLSKCICNFCKIGKTVLLMDICNFKETAHGNAVPLLELVYAHSSLQVVVASGSGSQLAVNENQYLKASLQRFLLSSDTEKIYLRHFNEKQAVLFMKLNSIKFEIEDIQHVTALNPLLLSLTQDCESLADVENNIYAIVKPFLESNFTGQTRSYTTRV